MTSAPILTPLGSVQVVLGTYDSQVLDSARYVQEVFAGTNPQQVVGVDTLPQGGKNFLVNGGFVYWTSGTGPIAATNLVLKSADGWSILEGTAQATASSDVGQESCLVFTPVAGQTGTIFQTVYEVGELRGRQVTFRVRVTGNIVTANLADNGGLSVNSPATDCTDGNWRTLVVTGTISATATTLTVTVSVPAIGSTPLATQIGSASLVAYSGPVANLSANWAMDATRMARDIHIYTVSARWYSRAALEVNTFYVPFHGAPVPIAPTGANISSTYVFGTSDNNIDTTFPFLASTPDQYGMNIQFRAVATTSDTYLLGMPIVVSFPTT